MRIGELAACCGVTPTSLRFYESVGVLPEPDRTTAGYRDYAPTAVDHVRFVKAAQAAGLTLTEIRGIVAVRRADGPPCAHVTDLLDRHANDLQQRISDLAGALRDLQRLRARAHDLDPSSCPAEKVCHVIPS